VLLLRLGAETLDLSDYDTTGVYVAKIDVGQPAVREVIADLPDRDGVLDQTAYVGGRLVTLSGRIVASATAGTRQQIIDRLSLFCRPGVRPTLTIALNDDVPRTIGLRGDQCAAPIDRPGQCPFAASWKAPDPRFYAADVDGGPVVNAVTLLPPISVAQGRVYPLTFPRGYPSGWGGTGQVDIDIDGSTSTHPRFTVRGPCTNPVITLNTGLVVAFSTLNLSGTDYVVIDTAARTVIANGDPGDDRYSTLDVTRTRWMPATPGTNRLTFTAATFAAPCTLRMEWTDAYI
jgi:hypothetical protein